MAYLSDEDSGVLHDFMEPLDPGCRNLYDRDQLVDAVESLIARHRAAELREAATHWQFKWPLHPLKPSHAQYVVDWLTAKADLLDPKDGAR